MACKILKSPAEAPHFRWREARGSTMEAVARYPVAQRTLDLKTESAYFRVRL